MNPILREKNKEHPLKSLNMYDKTLYLQRIFFALDRTRNFHDEDDREQTERLTLMYLAEGEEHINKAIESLEYVLELRRIFPQYKNYN